MDITKINVGATQNADDQDSYNGLEGALDGWLKTLKIANLTKTNYRSTIITFVRLLDFHNIYNPSQENIDNYFSLDNKSRQTATRFFTWIKDTHAYNKIRTHTNTKTTQPSTSSVDFENSIYDALSRLLKRWLNKSTYDCNTKASFQRYVNRFIIFLKKRHSFSPTVEDVKAYLKNNWKYIPPSTINENKTAIASFLQFMESLGIPQDHNVYDFLNINQS